MSQITGPQAEQIARWIAAIEKVDEDSAVYLAGPIEVFAEKGTLGWLVCVDAGIWNFTTEKP